MFLGGDGLTIAKKETSGSKVCAFSINQHSCICDDFGKAPTASLEFEDRIGDFVSSFVVRSQRPLLCSDWVV